MSADVNEVCRLLEARGVECEPTESSHEVRWHDAGGVRWSYYGRIYGGRGAMLCAYGLDPADAVELSMGPAGCAGGVCEVGA